MSFRFAIGEKLKTIGLLALLTGFSVFLLWEILSSASSGCVGDVVSRRLCRPDPLMKTYDISGREVLSFWDVYSGEHDGKLVITCGYVVDGNTVLPTDTYGRFDYAALRLDRSVSTGRHCFLAKVSRYTGPVVFKPKVAASAYPAVEGGMRLLEVRRVLPPY